MIREATRDDLPRIVEMGAQFHAHSPYAALGFDPEGFANFCAKLIEAEAGVILLSEDGMLGGLMNPAFFNPSALMGGELMWWAGSTGKQLREAFETWAAERGALGVQFSGLANEREATIRKVFARAGYVATEVAFLKRF